MVAGLLQLRVPERDATLDAFISPDPEDTEETEDVEDPEDAEVPEDAKEPEDAASDEEPAESDEEPAGAREESQTGDPESGTAAEEPVSELAETTFAWSPEGAGCAACGEQSHRRWRTDAGFVCQGCVDWERTRTR